MCEVSYSIVATISPTLCTQLRPLPGVGALAERAGVGPVAGVEPLVADEAALVPELLWAEGAGEEVAAALALAVLVLVPVPVALAAARAETHFRK